MVGTRKLARLLDHARSTWFNASTTSPAEGSSGDGNRDHGLESDSDLTPDLTSSHPGSSELHAIGETVIRLEDYVATQVIEQTVHLGDLARSVDCERWVVPDGAEVRYRTGGAPNSSCAESGPRR